MAGMNDINSAFKQAAGGKVSLIEGRMRYGDEGEHILEFVVSGDGGIRTLSEVLPKGADTSALVAGAIRCGVRMREPVVTQNDVSDRTSDAVEHIKAGEYELAPTEEAKPPIFF